MIKAISGSGLPFVLLCLLILEGCGTCINAATTAAAGGLIKLEFRLETKLQINFYNKRCPLAETIVENITWNRVATNSKLPAKLLRMQFHDCFVRGCDGSILLDSTENNAAEKEAIPNNSLAGFEVIDEIKKELEDKCPDVVSCADILALAARDAVSYQFKKPMWNVLLGRKDGRVSIASEVLPILPSPFSNFTSLLQNFQTHGMDLTDLVVLSGGHTIGDGHCNLIGDRLYNFTGNNTGTDPALDPEYARTLKSICTLPINPATELEMDPGSTTTFDTNYYVTVNQKKGIFQSDAALLENPISAQLVKQLQNPGLFFAKFAQSMKKLGTIIEVKDSKGEIRKNCRIVNS